MKLFINSTAVARTDYQWVFYNEILQTDFLISKLRSD